MLEATGREQKEGNQDCSKIRGGEYCMGKVDWLDLREILTRLQKIIHLGNRSVCMHYLFRDSIPLFSNLVDFFRKMGPKQFELSQENG